MTTTRAEHDLLLCIARRDLSEQRRAELHCLLSAPLDWGYLISTARSQGLIPLLYRHLSTVSNAVPAAQFTSIKQESIENCQSVLALLGRLTELLHLFNKQSLPVLVFKGPVLAEVAYGENSLRQPGDLDVLIARENFDRAKELLESLGYQMVPALTPAQQKAHLNFHCEIQFMRDNWFTVVDLHWSLAPKAFPFELNTEDVFARARGSSVGVERLRIFGIEDLILFQCMHGGKHYWSRLEWITSLAEIVARVDVDWNRLIQQARASHGVKMLALGLNLAEQLGDTPVPVDVLEEIDADGSMRQVAVETLSKIFTKPDAEFSSARAMRKNLQIMDRKRDVFASMLRVVFVPTLSDWHNLTLPAALQPLYYGYRPFRLMGAYAALLTRRLFRGAGSPRATASRSVDEPLTGGLIE
ncbi:MAG TPA: nucleotidyltransferase family protein [Pyrinomonadaceae bacterium]|nr:nucleotidyltransferase family protein [Pyrinomonadaceae bacterium]